MRRQGRFVLGSKMTHYLGKLCQVCHDILETSTKDNFMHEEHSTPILTVEHLSVTVDSRNILHDVSFNILAGETTAIIGPNGAGKTTLFRALLGLIPYDGSIRWRHDIRVGYVPQRFSVGPALPATVRELFLTKSPRFWFPRRAFREHLRHELDLVGLPITILDQPVAGLSSGQLQRALIARALIDHPDILLLDEPTAGIDIGFGETIYHLIQKMQKERGTTILFISHEIHIVSRYAHRVICINNGVVCEGTPAETLNSEMLATLYGEVGVHHHPHP